MSLDKSRRVTSKDEDEEEDITASVNGQILRGEELIFRLSKIDNLSGVPRLKRQIQHEINFLKKVLESGCIKKEHAKCSNIHHYDAVVKSVMNNIESCVAVLQSFSLNSEEFSIKRLCVDVVAEKGNKWLKVIARNPKALSQLSSGAGEFGQRSTVDQAHEYLACAQQHPFHFHTPKIAFEFACGIEQKLASLLISMGIEVLGEILTDTEEGTCFDASADDELKSVSPSFNPGDANSSCSALNLDITALIAYVSDLTNGGCGYEFQEEILTKQAEWERSTPTKPFLDDLFKGKELICCETAAQSFKSIIDLLAGPGELKRARELMNRVRVVPDQISERTKRLLTQGGKIKERSMVIFGTGDALETPTVTANKGFVLSAQNQGIEYAVFVHGSRALTEGKIETAVTLPSVRSESLQDGT